MKRFFLIMVVGVWSSTAHAIETSAKHAYLIDATTGTVLLNKDGEVAMPPSSMSKLMTAYVLFSRLKEGRVKLTDEFTVSEKAWRTQGSKTFVHVGDKVPVETLIRGIIVQSGNDACVTVAENISGSEEAFAAEMNRIGKEIGLTGSNFVNSTGWPDEGHVMTARDLAHLASRLIMDFPEYYHYYSEREFTYNKITQQNRNRLLASDIGVDGLKTGHTEVAGYGITLSAKKGERRVILTVNGLESDNARVEEGDRLLRWALREFENKKLLSAGQKLDDAPVWFGTSQTVSLVANDDVLMTLPVSAASNLTMTLKYNSPIAAPIVKGTHVADVIVSAPGLEPQTIQIVAGEDVSKLSGIAYWWAKIRYQITGS
ncbi:MAG: D-alanyl-D-alanine carboxypeptidase [Rickettsiales bacterium]|nr:D-alanyl-D-alanine carboxypeptidase [Rickettsiales bacterium]